MADEEEVHASYVSNHPGLGANVSSLLQSWGLGDLKSKFKSHHIEAQALLCLTEKDICELIPKIGRRAIFRSSLMEWRRQNKRFGVGARRHHKRKDSPENIPISPQIIKEEQKYSDDESEHMTDIAHIDNDMISNDMDSEEHNQYQDRPPSEPKEERRYKVGAPQANSKNNCQIDVRETLEKSYEGQQIIGHYEDRGNLDYYHRRRLVTLLINEVIRKDRWLAQDDFSMISHDIIQLFPREDKATYFTARNGLNKSPKGCLYNKYVNLTRKLRQEGTLQ